MLGSVFFTLALAFLLLAAPAVVAQVTPYVGYNTQHETPLFGAGYHVPVSATVALTPSIEAGLAGNENYLQANADVTVDVSRNGQFVPYVGAGITGGRMPMNGDTKWRAGGNALFGARVEGLGGFAPFAQFRYTIVGGGDSGSLMAGATFVF